MQTISDTAGPDGAVARPRTYLFRGRAPRVLFARGREPAPEPAGRQPPHPSSRAGPRRSAARARRSTRLSDGGGGGAARACRARARRAGGGAPGHPAAARRRGRPRAPRHRRHREHLFLARRLAPASRASSAARPRRRHRQLAGSRGVGRGQPAGPCGADAARARPPARDRAVSRRSPGGDRWPRPSLAAPRPAAARGSRGGAADPLRARRHHPSRDRRVVPAGRRTPARGDGARQRRGYQASGRGGARRLGDLRGGGARGAASSDADRAGARAAAGATARDRAPARQAADARVRRGAGRARRRRERVMDAVVALRRSIVWRTRLANLVGAVMAFVYFRFIDPMTSGPAVTGMEVVFSVVAFTALTIVGTRLATRWATPLFSGEPGSAKTRRRALLFPWAITGFTLLGWVMAGMIWGVLSPLLFGGLTLPSAVRAVIGIIFVGGTVTATIVFFSVESRWRQEVPRFFPSGDLIAVGDVPRLPVRWRLLVVFLATSVGPLSLLGFIAWRRGRLAAADPANAGVVLTEMLAIIAFFIVGGLVAAVR